MNMLATGQNCFDNHWMVRENLARGAQLWRASLAPSADEIRPNPVDTDAMWFLSLNHRAPLTLTSPAFAHEGAIPVRYTCEGEDISPPLAWMGVPDNAGSLVLIVSDPDAPDPAHPVHTWTHWILYDLPPIDMTLTAGLFRLPGDARAGLNDWGQVGYRGPCPPIGTHRYFFDLHALDCKLGELENPTRARVLNAIEGHAISHARLSGTYGKNRG